jgi:hypothetical protein
MEYHCRRFGLVLCFGGLKIGLNIHAASLVLIDITNKRPGPRFYLEDERRSPLQRPDGVVLFVGACLPTELTG